MDISKFLNSKFNDEMLIKTIDTIFKGRKFDTKTVSHRDISRELKGKGKKAKKKCLKKAKAPWNN